MNKSSKQSRQASDSLGESASVLYMSMSLDGYIAGPNDSPKNPGGDGFIRLHEWGLTSDGERHRTTGVAGRLNSEIGATGAVLAGRRTAEQVDHWGGNHHGVPVFVVSHQPPDPSLAKKYPLVTYVTDGIESAMIQAKAAAGNSHIIPRSHAELVAFYGITIDPEVAAHGPAPESLFSEADLARMEREPLFLAKARKAIRDYAVDYLWDGLPKDARDAYIGGGHDFEGARCSFQKFWRDACAEPATH